MIAAARSSGMAIRFEGPADLRAQRADRLPVVRVQARQLVEPIVDRRRVRHDPPEGVRRHAEASRHVDAFDPRKLPQLRALAPNDRDLRLVDLLQIQHVAVGREGHRHTPVSINHAPPRCASVLAVHRAGRCEAHRGSLRQASLLARLSLR